MPDMTVSFECYCSYCGAGICNNVTVKEAAWKGRIRLDIEPCEKCLESAKEEGFEDGVASVET